MGGKERGGGVLHGGGVILFRRSTLMTAAIGTGGGDAMSRGAAVHGGQD